MSYELPGRKGRQERADMPGTESIRLRARAGRALALLACLCAGAGCGTAGCGAAGHGGASPAGTTPATAKPSRTAGTGSYVKHAALLSAISCPSARSCVAVGSYYYGAAGPPSVFTLFLGSR